MSDERPPREGISNTPARMKPMKLPNTPINGFGQQAGDEDAGVREGGGGEP